jgi:hypothetical protein
MSLPLIERQTFTPGQVIARPDYETVNQLGHHLIQATPLAVPETPYFVLTKSAVAEKPAAPTLIGRIVARCQVWAEIVDPDDPTKILGGIPLSELTPVQANDWPHQDEPTYTVTVLD